MHTRIHKSRKAPMLIDNKLRYTLRKRIDPSHFLTGLPIFCFVLFCGVRLQLCFRVFLSFHPVDDWALVLQSITIPCYDFIREKRKYRSFVFVSSERVDGSRVKNHWFLERKRIVYCSP